MKTIVTIIATVLLSVMSLSAQNENARVYININGNNKEYITLDTDNTPLCKTIYENDVNGTRTAKIEYKWDGRCGWIKEKKVEYIYDTEGNLAEVSHVKWDNKKQDWSGKKQLVSYIKTDKGSLIALNNK